MPLPTLLCIPPAVARPPQTRGRAKHRPHQAAPAHAPQQTPYANMLILRACGPLLPCQFFDAPLVCSSILYPAGFCSVPADFFQPHVTTTCTTPGVLLGGFGAVSPGTQGAYCGTACYCGLAKWLPHRSGVCRSTLHGAAMPGTKSVTSILRSARVRRALLDARQFSAWSGLRWNPAPQSAGSSMNVNNTVLVSPARLAGKNAKEGLGMITTGSFKMWLLPAAE